MSPSRARALRRSVPVRLGSLLGLALTIATAHGQSDDQPDPTRFYRIFVEPAALARPVSSPLEGARKTVVTPMRQQGDRFVPWDKEAFDRLRIGPGPFLERAARVADADLGNVRVRRLRGPEGGEYVLITSEQPIVAALMFSPRLRRWLEPALGERQWLVAPDQSTLYIFSAESPEIRSLGPKIAALYEQAVWPASLEVFQRTPEKEQPEAVAALGGPR